MEEGGALFWADKFAEDIIHRKKYSYVDKPYTLPKKPSIKTSSSLSGVLHIGRLTDIIRGEAVYRALKDKGVPAEFIYVAEDMDPLRKIPKGVPDAYREYIGVPVTDIPDPWGCHKTYADHHITEFFDIFADFVEVEPTRYSMREEYRKGNFDWAVDLVLKNSEKIREIINSFKDQNPTPAGWVPYQAVCEKCGKIMTTVVDAYKDGKVHYTCKDYEFKSETAKGCGHEGWIKAGGKNGKMVWKSEWAAQWKLWDVVGEGAGKEYVVPNSAFFVNAHICEKVYGYPATTPIFYEHITVGGGEKMSASVGNVVFPRQWLEVAPAEALRLLFLKRINKARDFKWEDTPLLMDELDQMEKVYYGVEKAIDEKEEKHLKRLYELVLTDKPPKEYTERMPYGTAAMVSQIALGDESRVAGIMKQLGYEMNARNREIMPLAGRWASEHGEKLEIRKAIPKSAESLTPKQKEALAKIADLLDKNLDRHGLAKEIFAVAKGLNMKPPEVFTAIYKVILDAEKGPKSGVFLLSLDKGFVQKRFRLQD
jgi:lysyl-tRNA synthetase class 1